MTTGIGQLELRTERLVIRPWRRSDLDIMAGWAPFADPLEQTWNWTQQLTTMSLDFFFAAHQSDQAQHIWTLTADGTVLGLIMLNARDQTRPTLGISLGGSAMGHGYGREALRAFFDAYFRHCPHHTIHLEVALANRRALRLYEALHFHETRRFWRDAGSPHHYAFLRQPTYRDVEPLFRWSRDALYQLCVEMELGAETWNRFVV